MIGPVLELKFLQRELQAELDNAERAARAEYEASQPPVLVAVDSNGDVIQRTTPGYIETPQMRSTRRLLLIVTHLIAIEDAMMGRVKP